MIHFAWLPLLILFLHGYGYAQKSSVSYDEIKNQLSHKSLTDQERVELYLELYNYFNANKPDSAMYYALMAYEKAGEIHYIEGEIKAKTNIGSVYFYQGDYANALQSFITSNDLTEIYIEKNGLDNFSMRQRSKNFNNIGLIYLNQHLFSDAENYLLQSLELDIKLNDQRSLANSYNNLGAVKENQNLYDDALTYYTKSLQIKFALNDSAEIPSTLINIGVIKMNSDAFYEADTCFKRAVLVSTATDNLKDLSLAFINSGDLYYLQDKHEQAISYYDKAAAICEDQSYTYFLSYAYESMAMSYEKLGKYKDAYDYYKRYVKTQELLYTEENAKVISELQTKFETEKKEKEITLLKKDKELQEVALANSKRLLIISIVGLILVSGFIFYLILSVKQKKKINKEIQLKNKKLEIAYRMVEEKKQEIIDSINYAKRIQSAILPPKKYFDTYLPDNFILYQPKDIVAGDFYWLEYKNNKVLFAAADCTGHGVPGAMVSVICNNGLNRSVREHNITDPGKILDKTTEIVIQEFEKSDDEVKDGMDISLCVLENNNLYWAGANNPLFIVRKGTLIEYTANRQPIGKYAGTSPFDSHTITLEKEDMIYIFTDGFQDQFGGEKGKKFMVKKFKELLIQLSSLPLIQQKEQLMEAFVSWKGDNEQIDDVCIIGVRF
jgi:serine phosphatase RsbU (regulator of sigma subunit)/Tfp pilus assembly protein PilF